MTPKQLTSLRMQPGYFSSRTWLASLVGPIRSDFPVVELESGADLRCFWNESVVLACAQNQFERALRVTDSLLALPVWHLVIWTVDKGVLVQVVAKAEKCISAEIEIPEHIALKKLSFKVLNEYLAYEKTA